MLHNYAPVPQADRVGPMARRPRSRSSGFALVVALSLMAFILVLLLGLTSVLRVETEVSSTESKRLEARMNAMLALQEALGELQRTTGPDQRVTATGSLWENPAKGTEHLVGVWSAEDNDDDNRADGVFLRWLVSRADRTEAEQIGMVNTEQPIAFVAEGDDSYYSAPDTHVVLVSTGSTFPTDLSDANEPMRGVAAEKREVRGDGDQVVGKYAWWVGDEGAKAKINIVDPVADSTTDPDELDRFRRAAGMSMPRVAGEAMESLDFLQPNAVELTKMADRSGLDFLAGDAAQLSAVKERFHDFTFWSYGVQSDSKNGGLKKDLSLLFELDEAEWRGTDFYAASPTQYVGAPYVFGTGQAGADVSLLFNPRDGDFVDGQPLSIPLGDQQIYGPTWDRLRDYYRTYREVQDRATNPIVGARSFQPSTSQLPGSTARQWARSASRGGMRALLGSNEPLLSRMREVVNDGKNVFDEERGDENFPFNRSTGANRAPHLIRVTLQVCVDWVGNQVDYVLLPAVYLHNPYNVRLDVNPSRFVLNLGQQCRIYSTLERDWADASTIWVKDGDVRDSKTFTVLDEFTPDGVTILPDLVDTNASRFVGKNAFSEVKFSIPAATYEPGEIRVYFPTSSGAWDSDVDSSMGLLSAINNSEGGSGLVIHRENLTIDLNQPDPLVNDPPLLKSHFMIGTSAHWFMYGWELGNNPNPGGDKQYDVVNSHKVHQYDMLKGFNSARIPSDSFMGDLAGMLEGDGRTVIFTFDSYLKPVELYYPTASSGLASTAQDALAFPTFVASNPLAPGEDRYSNYRQGSGIMSVQRNAYLSSQVPDLGLDLISNSTFADRGLWGSTVTEGSIRDVSVLDLPTSPLHSIGRLQHANLLDQPHYPALAIGNSFPSPFLNGNDSILDVFTVPANEGWQHGATNDAEKAFIDLSYFANHALWDGYFFSSIAPLESDSTFNNPSLSGNIVDTVEAFVDGRRSLNNPRLQLFQPAGEGNAATQDRLRDYETSAARLLVDGSFNVNSTSVEAWRAFLGGLNESEILAYDGDTVESLRIARPAAFPRQTLPVDEESFQGDYQDEATWQGYKVLDDAELDALANAIVTQIRERALVLGGGTPQPLASLASFVNRMPYSGEATHRARGLLQQAIDDAGVNEALRDEAVEGVSSAELDSGALDDLFDDKPFQAGSNFFKPFANQDFELSSAAAAPGFLLQSDVLQSLAPYLSVRSDTFRIRTYGEVVDPITGKSEGKAWLEAIVQRTPEPVVPSASNPDEPETTVSDLGRRYKIVKLNWLDEDQI